MKKITRPDEEYIHRIDLSNTQDIAELENALRTRFGSEMDEEKLKRLAKAIMETAKQPSAKRTQP